MAVVVVKDRRSETFTFGLVTAVVVLALASAAMLVPVAPCPACPPNIFTITTTVTVPGGPITDPCPVFVCSGDSGKVSLFKRWRFGRRRSTRGY